MSPYVLSRTFVKRPSVFCLRLALEGLKKATNVWMPREINDDNTTNATKCQNELTDMSK